MENKNNPFKVPENYFEDLYKDILSSTKEKKNKKLFFGEVKNVYKYAAAFALMIAIGGSVVWNFNNKEVTSNQVASTIIKNENVESVIKEEIPIKNTETKEINNETIEILEANVAQSNIEKNQDFELSDAEKEYLEDYLHGDFYELLTYND